MAMCIAYEILYIVKTLQILMSYFQSQTHTTSLPLPPTDRKVLDTRETKQNNYVIIIL